MEPVALSMVFLLLLGGGVGCIPLVLLFVDYRRRGQWHKPFIYLAAFALTFAVLLPLLLQALGLWLALVAPLAVLAYAVLAKAPAGRR